MEITAIIQILNGVGQLYLAHEKACGDKATPRLRRSVLLSRGSVQPACKPKDPCHEWAGGARSDVKRERLYCMSPRMLFLRNRCKCSMDVGDGPVSQYTGSTGVAFRCRLEIGRVKTWDASVPRWAGPNCYTASAARRDVVW